MQTSTRLRADPTGTPGSAIYEYEQLIDSSEIEPSDWIRIATDIERNYQSFDGFIVLHGTDTLAFSASALSFLLVRDPRRLLLLLVLRRPRAGGNRLEGPVD